MPGAMRGSDDVTTLLERLVPLVERLQGQDAGGALGSVPGVTPIATPQPAQLGKALDLIKTILAPGADGKPLPLGQVNGALGQTIGNLLNGKKTALGLLGAVVTPMLTQASTTTALAPLLAMLTPAAGLSGFALPIFLGLTAWGVLGKMEKWSQGTAPRPKACSPKSCDIRYVPSQPNPGLPAVIPRRRSGAARRSSNRQAGGLLDSGLRRFASRAAE